MSVEAERRADQSHRRRINNEAVEALVLAMSRCHGGTADEAIAIGRAIITAIAKGEVPHVAISY
jgi:hypothetical protein